jgi:amino acid permease
MFVLVKLVFLLTNLGFVISYAILINKVMARGLWYFLGDRAGYTFLTNSEDGKFYIVIFLFMAFCLSLFKNLSSLRYLALTSVVFTIYITGLIIVEPLTGRLGSL